MPHLAEDLVLYKIASGKWDIAEAKKILQRNDFQNDRHLELYDAMIEIHTSGKAITPIAVIQKLVEKESIDAFGGADSFLSMISISEKMDLDEDINSIKAKSLLRKISEHATEKDAKEAIEKIKNVIQKTNTVSKSKVNLKFISEISNDYFKTPPLEKPRLLYFMDPSGGKTTFLFKEIVAILVGEGGRGKTHLLALLGGCVATGVPFLDQIEVEKPGSVCFVAGENNNDDIHRLLFKTYKHIEKLLNINSERKDGKNFGLHFPNPLDRFAEHFIPVSVHGMSAHFVDREGNPTEFYNQFLNQLKEKEPKDGFQLIILDPVSRFAGPEAEKDNAIATSFISCLERIPEALIGKPTIILSHHKSKVAIREKGSGQADSRGVSGLTDGARWQANLSKWQNKPDYSILEVTKTNFTSYPNKLVMRKGRDGIPEFIEWEKYNKEINSPIKNKHDSRFGEDGE